MPTISDKDLTFHTRFDRRAHGCLPLFVVVVFLAVFTALWLVPVRKPEPLKPAGVGSAQLSRDEITDFLVRERSPLPLLQPRNVDPEFDERHPLSVHREFRLQAAPPAPLFGAPDSAVLNADDLLELPPDELLVSPQGKEVAR